MAHPPEPPFVAEERAGFDLNLSHGHRDLVQSVAFNAYGDRCATGAVDGKIRVFNRHKDGVWRLCDTWGAHGGETLELQWLPPTVYPNLLASLGGYGRFKLWAEDPSAAPGRRFSAGSSRTLSGKPAFETRSNKAPYRSFSIKHNEETRHTYLALLAADGSLSVYENDQPENLSEYTLIDDFAVAPKPARGEEVSFKVEFDPNPDPCYTALRAGVPTDSLAIVVAAMGTVKLYRSRDIITASYGVPQAQKEFYLAAEIGPGAHRGLVRDIAWAPGNVRGYDTIASACQDGYVRVFRVETPYDENDGKTWAAADLVRRETQNGGGAGAGAGGEALAAAIGPSHEKHQHQSGLSASLAKSGATAERQSSGQPGQVAHVVREVAKLDSHRTPVWRVDFDDDGQILGSTGDDGKLDGYVRVFRVETPYDENDGKTWAAADLVRRETQTGGGAGAGAGGEALAAAIGPSHEKHQHQSGLSASLAKSGATAERQSSGQPGQVAHVVREVAKLDSHRTPVWRVDFDDDGQILGSTGDDGKLVFYRQTPQGAWAKSSELGMLKTRMATPS
ncbi:hypothetical protein BN1708_007061 [Verticillium longisporum]|uniref:Uncharacterized protein n=1 Tax=Verticillium longisporum TaxID=100787 RepID=A0A0G4MQK6_VERLO|nr:hypothetical protein BN1708_007061 [Verticillium longisporum]